jgi:Raf kinase inhibitor-like YbhB/YbcL family protein
LAVGFKSGLRKVWDGTMVMTGWLTGVMGRVRAAGMHKRRRQYVSSAVPAMIETLEVRQVLAAGALTKDIKPGAGGAFEPVVISLGAGSTGVYFGAEGDATKGRELYKSDGTSAGTVLVKDINPGAESSSSPAGSTQVKSGLNDFATVGTTTYFAANDGTNGSELWKTDGTEAGTLLVKDIEPGAGHSEPSKFVAFGANKVLFYAKTAASGYELWISDGTDAGTTMVKEIQAGAMNGVDPDESPLPVVIGTTAFFTANNGATGFELWKTDGTSGGTVLVKDVNPGAPSLSAPQFAPTFAAVGTRLYFDANTATQGTELWTSDGTEAGTTIVKDLFTGNDPNNAANPASSSPSNLTPFGNKLVFAATTAADGNELFITDGTDAGTTIIKDIFPGQDMGTANSSRSRPIGVIGTTLYFSGNDGTVGTELWKTDGTSAGTSLVKDINAGSSDGVNDNEKGIVFDGRLYFVGETLASGRELFTSDGTAAGTVLDTDVNPGSAGNSNIASLTVAGGKLFFLAETAATGKELWARSPNATTNTAPVIDNSGDPYYIAGVGARLNASLTNGILLTDLLARGAGGTITDADAGAQKGIAVTAIDKTFGKWQFTNAPNPAETDWTDIDAGGAVSDASALLLAADATTRIRMISALKPHHDGTVAQGFLPIESKLDAGITFRAWDRFTGTAGQRGDTTTNGGATAFSTAKESAKTFFEARLFRSFNENAGLNVYTLQAEFEVLVTNPAYKDRSTDAHTGFTIYLSPLTAAVPTAGMFRMYYGVQFNDDGTETDMGYRYLTTNGGEASILEGLGRADKRAARQGAYFRELGVNNGTAITGYIAQTVQPGTTEMFQVYRLDLVGKPTRPGGTPEGSPTNTTKQQEIGDHVYSTNFSYEMSEAGKWVKEASRGFVRELSSNTLVLESTTFTPSGNLADKNSLTGGNKSPDLKWTAPPAGTQSFAIIMEDNDAPGGAAAHWVVWNIPVASRGLTEAIAKLATLPDNTKQGTNTFGTLGYDGPNSAAPAHAYFFSIFALSDTLNLPETTTANGLRVALTGKVLASGRTVGFYAKP